MPGTSLQTAAVGGGRGATAREAASEAWTDGRVAGGPDAHTVVVVDAMPLFRAGAAAALRAAGTVVTGEAVDLAEGVAMARARRANVLLVADADVAEVREAVGALPGCAVVALLTAPTRHQLMEMLGAGVAGLAMRSLTAEELVGTVRAAAGAGERAGSGAGSQPVFVPLPVAQRTPDLASADGPGPGADVLTPKELEVLSQLASGASYKRIAEVLYVTPATVKTHLGHIYAKLGARGRHEAISQAFAQGLLR